MGSSAILGRWISRSGATGIFRSHRMMSSTNSVNSSGSASAPWLMLPYSVDDRRRLVYRFYCFVNHKVYNFLTKSDEVKMGCKYWTPTESNYVGSSHGWLAFFDRRKDGLFLSDPIADRYIQLPPVDALGAAHSVILSSSPEEKRCLALMTFGSGHRLALCSPRRRSHGWTVFGGNSYVYDSLAYSSRHERLFCVTTGNGLEVWDLRESSPRRDRKMEFGRPVRSELKKLRYIVCAEQTGELFLVVRHVILRPGRPGGSWVDRFVFSQYKYNTDTEVEAEQLYNTLDFDVYKIDLAREKLMRMEDSLEGLAMFVGNNHSLAIPASEVPGLKSNSVYFTDDRRLRKPYMFGGFDNGVFDYQKRIFSPYRSIYYLDYPVWFTHSKRVVKNFNSGLCSK